MYVSAVYVGAAAATAAVGLSGWRRRQASGLPRLPVLPPLLLSVCCGLLAGICRCCLNEWKPLCCLFSHIAAQPFVHNGGQTTPQRPLVVPMQVVVSFVVCTLFCLLWSVVVWGRLHLHSGMGVVMAPAHAFESRCSELCVWRTCTSKLHGMQPCCSLCMLQCRLMPLQLQMMLFPQVLYLLALPASCMCCGR